MTLRFVGNFQYFSLLYQYNINFSIFIHHINYPISDSASYIKNKNIKLDLIQNSRSKNLTITFFKYKLFNQFIIYLKYLLKIFANVQKNFNNNLDH